MPLIAVKNEDKELQSRLRQLAEDVMSEISEMDASNSKELLGVFVSELFRTVAEQEHRETRCRRQAEAVAAAKARGVRFGRRRNPLPENFNEQYEAWQSGEVSMTQAAKACGITRTAFSRAVERMKEGNGSPDTSP